MTTLKGEIARSEPERTNEQLSGTVWLCQKRGEWPVYLCTSPSQVIHWLEEHPEGSAWEYWINPVRRVETVRPEPYLQEMRPPREVVVADEPEPLPEMEESDV